MDPFVDPRVRLPFEDFVEQNMMPPLMADGGRGKGAFDPKHRTIVCRHWLLGLCQKGSACEYLHRLDKSRMPLCKHNKVCKIRNCPLKHEDAEEKEECPYYRQGFCKNGPHCKYRHIKLQPDACPVVASFEPCISSAGVGGIIKKRSSQTQPNDMFKVSICKHWLESGDCPFHADCHYAHGEAELKSTHTHEECDDSRVYDPHRLLMNSFMQLPFPSSERVAYFLVHAPDLRSLVVSKRRGVWRAPLRTIADMNHAITVMGEKPLLFFSVGPLKGIYGVATLAAPIPVPPAPAQAAEFEVKWLRCMRVSAKVVTISKVTIALGGGRYPDYKMERGVGYELMLIAFRKPEWDWSADADKIQPFATAANASLPEGVLFGEDWVAGGRDGPPPPPRRPPDLPPPAPPRALPPAQLDYYTGDIPGFVVVAMPAMLEETFARLLFGMPPQTMELAARHIVVNTPLFLLDSQNQLLYGIFQSTSGAGDSIVPGAFRGGSARSDAFPVQTRFAVALECPPVAEADKELRQALAGRALGVGPLSLRETRAVANVLAARAGFFSGPARPFHEEHRPHRDGGGGGGSSFYKPPFGFVDVVYINLPASPFEIKKMVLGQDAFKVLEIINALGPRSIKIRIRGVGSGFKEGPGQQELPEPLHLNVCAESEELLRLAVARVHVLVEGARMELLSQGR